MAASFLEITTCSNVGTIEVEASKSPVMLDVWSGEGGNKIEEVEGGGGGGKARDEDIYDAAAPSEAGSKPGKPVSRDSKACADDR